MITLQLGCSPVFVGFTNAAEQYFTNTGSWDLDGVTYVAALTNAHTDVSFLRSGAVVTVTGGGDVLWSDGPNFSWAVTFGFSMAITTIGVILFFRRLFGHFGGLAGVETGERS